MADTIPGASAPITTTLGITAHNRATCRACAFYMAHLEEDVNGAGQSECRRYPPTVLPHETEGVFPIVRESDWCGEFRAAD